MRGKRLGYISLIFNLRNIPAYAGKTHEWCEPGQYREEHPRVCGENIFSPLSHAPLMGTSPRMRGKQEYYPHKPGWYRNIPAYAGKTRRGFHRGQWCKEHPRVCGENARNGMSLFVVAGTSPRMRGKLIPRQSWRRPRGNIPAYAGKTMGSQLMRGTGPEHPRVCGENPHLTRAGGESWGTSPRMRGKLSSLFDAMGSQWNIPAYAGKTVNPPSRHQDVTEHPRVCGENSGSVKPEMKCSGTSPRMRGKPDNYPRGTRGSRNIPAYAGKT